MVLLATDNLCMLEKHSFGAMCGVPDQSVVPAAKPAPSACGPSGTADKHLYKLVKVGDDGSLEPASAEEAARVESMFHEDKDDGADGSNADGLLGGDKAKDSNEAEKERQRLLQRMDLLNLMLARVADEEILHEEHMGLDQGNKVILGGHSNGGLGNGFSKRSGRAGEHGEGSHSGDESDGLLWGGGLEDDAWGLDHHILGEEMDWDVERDMGGFDIPSGGAQQPGGVSEEPVDDSSSLADLRASYRSTYGRSTTSNNRQWLIKRLSGSGGGGAGAGLLDLDGDLGRKAANPRRAPAGGKGPVGGGPTAAVPGASPRGEGKRQARPNPRYFDQGSEDGEGLLMSPGSAGGASEVSTPVKVSGGGLGHRGSSGSLVSRTSMSGGMVARSAAARLKSRAMAGKNGLAKLTGPHQHHHHHIKSDLSGFKRRGGPDSDSMRKKHRPTPPKTPSIPKSPKPGMRDLSTSYDSDGSDDEDDSDSDSDNTAPKRTATGAPVRAAATKRDSQESSRRRKHHNPWTLEESKALIEGVARCGGGKWADIKKLGFAAIENRTAVDLKDKWRNLLRIAMLPTPASKAVDKKREIPPQLLLKVRELANRSNKKPPPHDGRSNRGRPRGSMVHD